MFRRFSLGVLFLALPSMGAVAQQSPSAVSPQIQALQQTVIRLTGESLDWQTQSITFQKKVEELEAKIKTLGTCPEQKGPPSP